MIEVKDLQQAAETNPVLRKMSEMGHEQVLFCQDNETGLKAIIAIAILEIVMIMY